MNVFKYAILISLTFALFVVIFMPASLVWRAMEDKVPAQLLSLSNIEGTPWQGRAAIDGDFMPSGEIEWDLQLLGLISGTVKADLVLQGPTHQVTGTASYQGGTWLLEGLSGRIESAAVNSKIEHLGYQVSGILDLKDVSATIRDHWLTGLQGNLSWNGGELTYSSPRSNFMTRLPALRASLRLADAEVAVAVDEEQQGQPVLDLHLQRDGWARVAMRGRLFDLAGQSWPMPGGPADVVMELEAQLWK